MASSPNSSEPEEIDATFMGAPLPGNGDPTVPLASQNCIVLPNRRYSPVTIPPSLAPEFLGGTIEEIPLWIVWDGTLMQYSFEIVLPDPNGVGSSEDPEPSTEAVTSQNNPEEAMDRSFFEEAVNNSWNQESTAEPLDTLVENLAGSSRQLYAFDMDELDMKGRLEAARLGIDFDRLPNDWVHRVMAKAGVMEYQGTGSQAATNELETSNVYVDFALLQSLAKKPAAGPADVDKLVETLALTYKELASFRLAKLRREGRLEAFRLRIGLERIPADWVYRVIAKVGGIEYRGYRKKAALKERGLGPSNVYVDSCRNYSAKRTIGLVDTLVANLTQTYKELESVRLAELYRSGQMEAARLGIDFDRMPADWVYRVIAKVSTMEHGRTRKEAENNSNGIGASSVYVDSGQIQPVVEPTDGLVDTLVETLALTFKEPESVRLAELWRMSRMEAHRLGIDFDRLPADWIYRVLAKVGKMVSREPRSQVAANMAEIGLGGSNAVPSAGTSSNHNVSVIFEPNPVPATANVIMIPQTWNPKPAQAVKETIGLANNDNPKRPSSDETENGPARKSTRSSTVAQREAFQERLESQRIEAERKMAAAVVQKAKPEPPAVAAVAAVAAAVATRDGSELPKKWMVPARKPQELNKPDLIDVSPPESESDSDSDSEPDEDWSPAKETERARQLECFQSLSEMMAQRVRQGPSFKIKINTFNVFLANVAGRLHRMSADEKATFTQVDLIRLGMETTATLSIQYKRITSEWTNVLKKAYGITEKNFPLLDGISEEPENNQ